MGVWCTGSLSVLIVTYHILIHWSKKSGCVLEIRAFSQTCYSDLLLFIVSGLRRLEDRNPHIYMIDFLCYCRSSYVVWKMPCGVN